MVGQGKSQGSDPGLNEIIEMGGDPENPFTSLIAGIHSGLAKFEEMLPEAGVAPELVQEVSAIREQYTQVLQEIQQSGSQPQAPAMDVNAGAGGVPRV